MKNHFLFFTVMLLYAVPLMAQHTTKTTAKAGLLPVDTAVKIGKLPNGLTYYIRKNSEPAKRAVLYLVTHVGSLMEDDDQLGLAHFTEHMAFNGTRDFPKNELVNYLQKAGVKFGADVNASTSFNETIYKLPLPTDSMAVFKKSFSMMANWAGLVTFEEGAINRERGIILEEERSRGKNVAERIQKQVIPALLNNSRYASRMPIGKDELLKTFKPDVIKRFYKDWYRPDLQAVIAVGDFDPKLVERLIRENFSTLKNPMHSRKRINYSIPPDKGTQIKIITDPEQTSTRMQIIVRHQGKAVRTSADLIESLSRSLLNRMLGSRVAELRQQANAPLLIGSIGYGRFLADIDAFTIAVTAKPGQLEQAAKKILAVNEQARQFGFTQAELESAKKSLFNTIERQWKERDKNSSAAYVTEYLNHFTKGEAIPGIDYEYHFLKNNLAKIKLEQLDKLIRALNSTENRVIIIEAPEKDKALLPDQKKLLSWISDSGRNLQPYRSEAVPSKLLDNLPEGGVISAAKTNVGTGVSELILGNGARVILKPTRFKNDQIIINGYSYGGTSIAADSIYHSAALAALLVNRSGLGKLTRAQLNKMLSGRSVNLSASISDFTEGLSGSASPAELETALQLIYLYFTQPRKDPEAWLAIISQQEASMANRSASPNLVFQDTVTAVLNSYNPRKTAGNLDGTSIDQAYRFYQDRFADASDFTFILVGAIDTAKAIPLIKKYLGNLPAIHRKEHYKDAGFGTPRGQVSKTVYKGIEAKSRVQLVYSGTYTYNDLNNIQLEALKEMINYRILNRLRAKESGVYTPSVNVGYGNIPVQRYSITISFNCAPENVQHLIEASKEEVERLKREGPEPAEIQKFMAAQLRMRETQVESNTWWVYYLRNQYMNRDKPETEPSYNKLLGEVSPESVRTAARQYAGGENLAEFILMPEKKGPRH
ncbi:M16 family metallopeptidase [Pedobacter heparinus]|uniref:Peptidase M16 domain protein n=1 Tax=Pedobacter heparinus (strain ATCC 13125 / DSM 2366 / CIP 104194 / JCM 7457 / NBRC 12017 / NCIMB 9290 / NRRL B-14731 / HIM 762-3) TaxID=485917 RepID=C6XXM8_PEDHD|nr:insulinase family protein [Pedobacter heparinus]ACU02282.1 peptidase M16 domain protein [Pedobacter heparinus DSM 2366]